MRGSRFGQWSGALAAVSVFSAAFCGHAQNAGAPSSPVGTSARVFEEAWRFVRDDFYDRGMGGLDWDGVRRELAPRAAAAPDGASLSAVINEALDRLHASHTRHYSVDQREYYELLDVFFPDGVPGSNERHGALKVAEYVGIGIVSRVIDGRTFVEDVYEGGPAHAGGIRVGDELVSVEGAPWGDVVPFRDRAERPTRVVVQRTPDAGSRIELTVLPRMIRPREMFLRAMREGAVIMARGGHRVAYVRARSYAHPDYQEAIKRLLGDTLSGGDALVLDLRGGWGGADPEYINLFSRMVPTLEVRARDGEVRRIEGAWTKPVVVLIDSGTRSGKEVFALAFKKHTLGTLVGTRTAGAVLAGSPRLLSDLSLLCVAVADVRADGVRLEGIGVEPDVTVVRPIPYCNGSDPQLEAALDAAVRAIMLK